MNYLECAFVPMKERISCGEEGTSEYECLSLDCCWDGSEPGIQCFHKRSNYLFCMKNFPIPFRTFLKKNLVN